MERKPFIVYADSMQEKLGWVRTALAQDGARQRGGGLIPRPGLRSGDEGHWRRGF
eukprot:CAMPEP_0205896092 /NCGR_PEP_ID=MMETSP1083-20121108/24763_1 /ASSEMBLY_ACC=CAM_ASM_000430 /TAXON_ID=97485 /ORGANISM="Prymnesium parvum, Strain Texoma1" /LENGTH=54 /DNA_ID=CAMNT_0053261129 /DNA_START=389 /DNA_END=551 /DNA_ORIENTATION=+